MVGVLYIAIKNLAHGTENVYGCYYNTGCGYNGTYSVESIVVLERTYKDGHFGHKSTQSRQTKVSQTGNDIAYGQERHNLHQTTHHADIASVGTSVNHTDKGKEQGSHQPVRKHLQDGTGARGTSRHEQSKEYKTTMRYR